MKKFKIVAVILILGLVMSVSLPEAAYSFGFFDSKGECGIDGSKGKGREGKGGGESVCSEKGGKMDKMMEELGITAEQKNQLKTMREGNKETYKNLKTQMNAKHEAMREELGKDQVDKSKVDAIINDIGELYKQKMQGRVDKVLGMKSVLTPEQNAAMKEKMKTCRKDKGNRKSEKEQA